MTNMVLRHSPVKTTSLLIGFVLLHLMIPTHLVTHTQAWNLTEIWTPYLPNIQLISRTFLPQYQGYGMVLSVPDANLTSFSWQEVNQLLTLCGVNGLSGVDVHNNSLTTFPDFSGATVSNTFSYLDLSQNSLNATLLQSTYPGLTCNATTSPPGCVPPGSPPGTCTIITPAYNCGTFIEAVKSSLTYFDLSYNPIKTLPAGFGNGATWLTSVNFNSLPEIRCAYCQLTGLSQFAFARPWGSIDLSGNNFSNMTALYWSSTFGNLNFLAYYYFNLSHCQLKKLPSFTTSITVVGPGGGPHSSPYTAVYDFSYNDFSQGISDSAATPLIDLSTSTFSGSIIMSHSNMTALRNYYFPNSLANLDLSYNNFGAEVNLANFRFDMTTSSKVGETGNFLLNDAGITQINQSVFMNAVFYKLDLSGNYFGSNASWTNKPFEGLTVTHLYLNRCRMRSNSLMLSHSPDNNGGQLFENVWNITNLYMMNDGTDETQASWNIFDPLPSQWLIDDLAPFSYSLQGLWIGEVVNVETSFWNDWVTDSTLPVVIHLADGIDPIAVDGPLFNIMSGYGDYPPTPRMAYSLEVKGSGFTTAGLSPITNKLGNYSITILEPTSLSLPLDPAFLHEEFFSYFPTISSLTYTNPTSYFVGPTETPWSENLTTSSVLSTLLCYSTGLSSFSIVLPATTSPISPVSELPDDFFQCLIPSTGQGSLTTIDLASAQMTYYPQNLFSGLSRASTYVYLDMNLLYGGYLFDGIPVGLWDDITGGVGIGPNGAALTTASKLNKARNCYLLGSRCDICPDGSYISSLSGYYYCSSCAQGSYCTGGSTKPCPKGTYQPLKGSSSCNTCRTGTYNDAIGQAQSYACLACDAGTEQPFLNATSLSDCTPCDAGSYSALAATSECSLCPAGTWSSPKSTSCTLCTAGTWSNIEGATSKDNCTKCDHDKSSPAGSTSSSDCIEKTCDPGYYSTSTNATCVICPAGFFCTNNRAFDCNIGEWSAPGTADKCNSCPPGTYQPLIRQTSNSACLLCPVGTYNDQQNWGNCTACSLNTVSDGVGKSSKSDCHVCDPTIQICPRGSANVNITNGVLLPAATTFIGTSGVSRTSRAAYAPIRGGDSLRLTVDPNDPSLLLASASNASIGSSSVSHSDFDPTGATVVSNTMFILMVSLIVGACVPLILYRFIPFSFVGATDQMAAAHKLESGGIMVKRPTQWSGIEGAAWTIAFLLLAIYTAIQLGTASNATMVNTLQPASSNSNTGTAQAALEITLKAYGAPAVGTGLPHSLDSWCNNSFVSSQAAILGFVGNSTVRATIQGSACVMMFDCLDCGMSGTGSMTLTIPFVNQLIEWEVWTTGAIPGSWSRFYGVVSQESGSLLDARANLEFSAIEAYFLDQRSAHSITYCTDSNSKASIGVTGVTCSLPTSSSGSGFELAFKDYQTITAQDASILTADSTVSLGFVFAKQDVVYQTTVTAKLSVFQILSSVLATVVSLLSVFMLLFQVTEQGLRKLKISAGPIPVDIHVISQEEIAAEEEAARKQREKIKSMASKVVHAIEDHIPGHTPRRAEGQEHAIELNTASGSGAVHAIDMTDPLKGVHGHPTRPVIPQLVLPTEDNDIGNGGARVGGGSVAASSNTTVQGTVANILDRTNKATAFNRVVSAAAAANTAREDLAKEITALKQAQAAKDRQTAALLATLQEQIKALQLATNMSSSPQPPLQPASSDVIRPPSRDRISLVASPSSAGGLDDLSSRTNYDSQPPPDLPGTANL